MEKQTKETIIPIIKKSSGIPVWSIFKTAVTMIRIKEKINTDLMIFLYMSEDFALASPLSNDASKMS